MVRISTLNVRSLQQHRQDMEMDEFIMKSDILAIQETWMEADPDTPFPDHQDYYVHKRSKGIALLTKKKPVNVETFSNDCCSVIVAKYSEFDLINVYRFSGSCDVKQFTEDVLKLVDPGRVQVILGDTNLDLLKNPDNQFTRGLEERKFEQLVSTSTHILSGLLDHVYFYTPRPQVTCSIHKMHPQYWSDHSCVSVFLKMNN